MTSLTANLSLVLTLAAACALAGCDDEPKGSATTASVAVSGKAPQIAAAKPNYDFGKVKQGKEVTHAFKIRNAGAAPLLIHKAKGS